MGEKIVVGPITNGLRNDVQAFVIDNDSFPTLMNAYQWRGRIKRKRGTSTLGRLTRYFQSLSTSYSSTTTVALNGSGVANILTGFSLQVNGNLIPGTVTILVGVNTYIDTAQDGTLSPSGSINYATGVITIVAEAGNSASVVYRYYPDLPVMGLEDLVLPTQAFPGTLAFDTKYSYNINTTSPYSIYDVSFYKNPPVDATNLPGYVPKGTVTPTSWNGQDYQQFWTVNYEGALWATNGINIPFSTANIGMQFGVITNVVIGAAVPPAIATISIAAHTFVVGDFVFINEVEGITGINFQTGYVTAIVAGVSITVEFPNATLGGAYTSGGIAQYLTSRTDTAKDCIRWYDGDPTNGNVITPGLTGTKGWVNFAPPLFKTTVNNVSLANLPIGLWYLVGARMIVPFKDRLCFVGPVVQTSSPGSQVYLQDTIIYSQNGTPYYTSSFTGDASLSTTVFHPILVPTNQTGTASAYWIDQTGLGGYVSAGIDEPICTAEKNGDVLITGFGATTQARVVHSGNDIQPFNFYLINSELPSGSTFSAVNMDKGILTRGNRGFVVTTQVGAERFDLDIPDESFEIGNKNNGPERICSQRDFINEWVYFSYLDRETAGTVPNQTLQYNYRDNSWAIFEECYTTYGTFRKRTGYTWATLPFRTWREWTVPWNAGSSSLLQPKVIAGNQQGFVMLRDEGTGEGNSLYIRDISGSTVIVPNHSLQAGDYFTISGVIGTVGTLVNGLIFSVGTPVTTDTFTLNPNLVGTGTYVGGGLIKRMYVPFVQTKQFPVAWSMSRKTRLGPQRYLLKTTTNSQITLLIYLSQDDDNAYNEGPIVPSPGFDNSGLIYSTVLYTCPESSNLGLTPANTNLQMISQINAAGDNASSPQTSIWHRVNTSLIGDTIQLGFTMSDDQMRDPTFKNQFAEIELSSFILDVSPSQELA